MKRFFTVLLIFVAGNTASAEPMPWQIDFQEAASPLMRELHHFHNFLLIISAALVLFVVFLICYVIFRFNTKANPIPAKFTHNSAIEVIWTVIPILVLVIIAIPSFRLLKMAEHAPSADMTIKVLITAADVLHSFSVPAFGIKTDAVPGKINETWVKVEKKGVFYGQCSELCGIKHGFMPIAVEVVSKEEFEEWVNNAKIKFASSTNNSNRPIRLAHGTK